MAPLVLVVLALLEVAAHFWFARRAPHFSAYDALRAPIAELREAGDAVVVTPRWAEPMVRKAFAADGRALPVAALAGPSLEEAPAALEISLPGHRNAELDGWREAKRRDVSPFVVRRLVNPQPPDIVTDFVAAFDPQRVAVTVAPGTPCMWNPLARVIAGGLGGHPTLPRRRFVCPGAPGVLVGRTVIADQAWRPRRCVLAFTSPQGPLAIRYREVSLGKRLVGHGGLSWMRERARGAAPVELRVEVDGTSIGSFIHADGDGWAAFEMEVPASPKRRRDVTFFVSSPEDHGRDFCFEVRAR